MNNHRRYFTEIKEKKDDIDKELVQAEQELEDLMNQNIEEKLEQAVQEQEREQEMLRKEQESLKDRGGDGADESEMMASKLPSD